MTELVAASSVEYEGNCSEFSRSGVLSVNESEAILILRMSSGAGLPSVSAGSVSWESEVEGFRQLNELLKNL